MTRALSEALGRVLGCASVLKLGFCAADDFSRLARTPGLEAAAAAAAPVLDLQPRAGEVLGRSKRAPPGLAGTCTALLGAGLDKAQQQSDWGARPLTDAQLRYAALDAFCLPLLYDALEALPPAAVDDDGRAAAAEAAPGAGAAATTAGIQRSADGGEHGGGAQAEPAARCIGRPRHDAHRLCAAICRESGRRGGGGGGGVKGSERRPSGRAAARRLHQLGERAAERRAVSQPVLARSRHRRRFDVLVPGQAAAQEPRGASARRTRRRRRPLLPPPPRRLLPLLRPAAARRARRPRRRRRRRRRGGFTTMGPGHGAAAVATDASEHIVWRLVDADPPSATPTPSTRSSA